MLVTSAKRKRRRRRRRRRSWEDGYCKTRNKTNPLQRKRPDKESYAVFSLSLSLSERECSVSFSLAYYHKLHLNSLINMY
jgi:hypothetical protein